MTKSRLPKVAEEDEELIARKDDPPNFEADQPVKRQRVLGQTKRMFEADSDIEPKSAEEARNRLEGWWNRRLELPSCSWNKEEQESDFIFPVEERSQQFDDISSLDSWSLSSDKPAQQPLLCIESLNPRRGMFDVCK